MKLFLVEVKAFYDASYEGRIDKSYTELVVANTDEEAVDFINEQLELKPSDSYCGARAMSAKEIDSTKTDKMRKTQYFII